MNMTTRLDLPLVSENPKVAVRVSGLGLLVRKEIGTALRSRWFLLYCAVFLLAAVFLVTLGTGRLGTEGYRTSLRAAAGLMQLLMLMLPPMALLQGLASITDERDSGLLEYVLAQPVGAGQVYLSKWLGTAAVLSLAIVIGVAPGGMGAVLRGAPPVTVSLLLVLTVLLGVAFVELGLCAAAVAHSRAQATAFGIVAWIALTVLGTLGLMAAFVRWQLPDVALMAWSVGNPVEAFRIGVLTALDADLSLLGPVGVALIEELGRWGLASACIASLALWALIPGLVGLWIFRRRPLP